MKTRDYALLTLILLIFSLIFFLPHILIPKFLVGKPYYPLALVGAPIFSSDELTWPAAEAREVMDGRIFPTDPVVWEHKNAPSMVAQIPAIIIGLLGRFSGSINQAYLILSFVLPSLVFLSIFFLTFILTKEYLISCLVSIVTMMMTRPYQFFPPLNRAMVAALWGYLTNRFIEPVPFEFFRLPNPLLIFPFFVLTIIFLYLALEKKKVVFAVAGGFLFGLLFYVYFYFWTFVGAGSGIFLISSVLKKDRQRTRLLMMFLFTGGIISLFYWFNFFKFQQYPFKDDILRRAGIGVGRISNLFRTVQFLIFGFIFSLLVRQKDRQFWFLLTFLLGGLICLNIQLIAGYTFQGDHWTLRVINPWTMLMLGFVYFRLLSRKIFYKPLTRLLIFLFLGLGFWIQFSFAKKAYFAYTLPEEKIAAFAWLVKNTPKDSVVFSPSIETNALIPVYTHNNVFLPNGGVTLAATSEIIERVYVTYKLFGIKPEYLEEILGYSQEKEAEKEKNCRIDQCLKNRSLDFLEKEGAWFFFHMQSTTWKVGFSGWSFRLGLSEAKKQEIVAGFREFLKTKQYLPEDLRLDYVFFGPNEKHLSGADLNLDGHDFLGLVYQNQGVKIYQVKKLIEKPFLPLNR